MKNIIDYKPEDDGRFPLPDAEMIKHWFEMLLKKTGKSQVDELSEIEIKTEIEGVQGAISNERLWAHADPIHDENVINLMEYEFILKEMLRDKTICKED